MATGIPCRTARLVPGDRCVDSLLRVSVLDIGMKEYETFQLPCNILPP